MKIFRNNQITVNEGEINKRLKLILNLNEKKIQSIMM